MIRHAGAGFADSTAVLALAVAMIELPLRALLVPLIGLTPLLAASLLTAFGAAVTVSAIAVRAEEKRLVAILPQARSLEENCFVAVNRRHAL